MCGSQLVVCEWYLDQLQHSIPCQQALHSSAGLTQETLHQCWWQVLRRVEELEARSSGEPAGVVVVGAGYAGVELASTVAERLGRRAAVQLVSAG